MPRIGLQIYTSVIHVTNLSCIEASLRPLEKQLNLKLVIRGRETWSLFRSAVFAPHSS